MVRNSRLIKIIFWVLAGYFPAFGAESTALSQPDSTPAEARDARINPFLTRKEEKAVSRLGNAIPLDYLKVSAIFYSADPLKSRAIINGKVLVLGDSVDNKQIIKINSEEVILEDSQGHYVAKIVGLMDNLHK